MRKRTAGVMTALMRNGRDRRSGKHVMGHAIVKRVLLFGTRSADYMRASGHSGCIATELILQATTGRIHDRTRTLRRKVRFSLAPRAPSTHPIRDIGYRISVQCSMCNLHPLQPCTELAKHVVIDPLSAFTSLFCFRSAFNAQSLIASKFRARLGGACMCCAQTKQSSEGGEAQRRRDENRRSSHEIEQQSE